MNDRFVSIFMFSDKHEKMLGYINKKLEQCGGSICMLSIALGLAFGVLLYQRERLNELEKRLNKQEKAE